MFNSLSEKLESAFKHLKGQSRINDLNVANTLKDIRKALLDADVNFKIAKEFTDKIKEKAIGEKVINAISPGQLMVKIVQDELTNLMGGEKSDFNITGNPSSPAKYCRNDKDNLYTWQSPWSYDRLYPHRFTDPIHR